MRYAYWDSRHGHLEVQRIGEAVIVDFFGADVCDIYVFVRIGIEIAIYLLFGFPVMNTANSLSYYFRRNSAQHTVLFDVRIVFGQQSVGRGYDGVVGGDGSFFDVGSSRNPVVLSDDNGLFISPYGQILAVYREMVVGIHEEASESDTGKTPYLQPVPYEQSYAFTYKVLSVENDASQILDNDSSTYDDRPFEPDFTQIEYFSVSLTFEIDFAD